MSILKTYSDLVLSSELIWTIITDSGDKWKSVWKFHIFRCMRKFTILFWSDMHNINMKNKYDIDINFPLSIRPFGVWESSLERKWTHRRLPNKFWKNCDIRDLCHFFVQKLLMTADFGGNSGQPSNILYSHSNTIIYNTSIGPKTYKY